MWWAVTPGTREGNVTHLAPYIRYHSLSQWQQRPVCGMAQADSRKTPSANPARRVKGGAGGTHGNLSINLMFKQKLKKNPKLVKPQN